jgi:hypothetical protein
VGLNSSVLWMSDALIELFCLAIKLFEFISIFLVLLRMLNYRVVFHGFERENQIDDLSFNS